MNCRLAALLILSPLLGFASLSNGIAMLLGN
jgi:hypothetical protein